MHESKPIGGITSSSNPWLSLGAATVLGFLARAVAKAKKVAFDPKLFAGLKPEQIPASPQRRASLLGMISGNGRSTRNSDGSDEIDDAFPGSRETRSNHARRNRRQPTSGVIRRSRDNS